MNAGRHHNDSALEFLIASSRAYGDCIRGEHDAQWHPFLSYLLKFYVDIAQFCPTVPLKRGSWPPLGNPGGSFHGLRGDDAKYMSLSIGE
jgi:hypothetical protein